MRTACPLDCPDGCSLDVEVVDGRMVAVDAATGDGTNPFTQGFICRKVKHHARRVYSPLRVLTPLIRSGPKGSGEFRPAEWDEAVELVASRIRTAIDRSGVDSVVPYLYNSSAGVLASGALTPHLFARLGCPEVTHTICAATTGAAWTQVFGSMLGADPLDLAHSRLIVVWGANPNVSNTHLIPLINQAVKSNGARVVVIDPRRTGVAARADLHLPILPGTDVALALAMTRCLVHTGRHDATFLQRHTTGWERFVATAEEWTLDRCAEVCGLDTADIERFADLLTEHTPAMLRPGWGLERNRNGGSGWLAVLGLWAVAGHFGRRGSGVMSSLSQAAPADTGRLWPLGLERPQRRTISMNDVTLALAGTLPGVVQSEVLVVQGANPVVTAMDAASLVQQLGRDSLFTVVHEQVLTDTARWADVVLPATTHFEAADLASSYGSLSFQRIEPVIDRVGASRTNDEVAAALASALGLSSVEFDPDPTALAARIRTDSLTSSRPKLRAAGNTVQFRDTFPTGGMARLHDPSSELPLPQFVAQPTSGEAHGQDLALLTPASNRTINSMFAEFDPPESAVSLHPLDAAARGIADGATVRVWNHLAAVTVVARLDGSVRRGVASIAKGRWSAVATGADPAAAATVNALIPRAINDLSGGACFNDARVRVDLAAEETVAAGPHPVRNVSPLTNPTNSSTRRDQADGGKEGTRR